MMAGGIAWVEKFDPATEEAATQELCRRFLEVAEATGREGETLVPRGRVKVKPIEIPEKVAAD